MESVLWMCVLASQALREKRCQNVFTSAADRSKNQKKQKEIERGG